MEYKQKRRPVRGGVFRTTALWRYQPPLLMNVLQLVATSLKRT
jgi:hypothetical protein